MTFVGENRYRIGRKEYPVIAVMNPPIATIHAEKANNMPSGCAINADGSCPRTVWLHAVVMPHVGHGMSAAATQPHAGKPSCWWVPIPWGDGFNRNATQSSAVVTKPTPRACTRRARSDFTGIRNPSSLSSYSTTGTGYRTLYVSEFYTPQNGAISIEGRTEYACVPIDVDVCQKMHANT
jgi:hypothetical protein